MPSLKKVDILYWTSIFGSLASVIALVILWSQQRQLKAVESQLLALEDFQKTASRKNTQNLGATSKMLENLKLAACAHSEVRVNPQLSAQLKCPVPTTPSAQSPSSPPVVARPSGLVQVRHPGVVVPPGHAPNYPQPQALAQHQPPYVPFQNQPTHQQQPHHHHPQQMPWSAQGGGGGAAQGGLPMPAVRGATGRGWSF